MKETGILLLAFALTACTAAPTMEQLEYQAMLTGDWTEVEKRERILERRASRQSSQCPPGTVSYCERAIGDNRCACIDEDALRRIFVGR